MPGETRIEETEKTTGAPAQKPTRGGESTSSSKSGTSAMSTTTRGTTTRRPPTRTTITRSRRTATPAAPIKKVELPKPETKISKTEMLRKELIIELQNLRQIHKETLQNYIEKRQSDMVMLMESLGRDETTGNYRNKLSKKQISKMLDSIKNLKLKPEKGRKKDISRIDNFVSNTKITLSD